MKIMEAIGRLDEQLFNTYSQAEKIEWLSRLDQMVITQIIDKADPGEATNFLGYTAETPTDTQLLIPAPYDEAYLRWMEAQIHYCNGEYDRYNNAIILFNKLFNEYAAFYIQEHKPRSRGRRFLF